MTTIDNRKAFKDAHAMTRATIKEGDSYAVTFGACYRVAVQRQKAQPKQRLYIGEFIFGALAAVLLCVLLAVCAAGTLALVGAMFAGATGAYIGAGAGVALAAWQGAAMIADEYNMAIHAY